MKLQSIRRQIIENWQDFAWNHLKIVICIVQSETRLDRLKALYLSTYHLDITNGSHAQRAA